MLDQEAQSDHGQRPGKELRRLEIHLGVVDIGPDRVFGLGEHLCRDPALPRKPHGGQTPGFEGRQDRREVDEAEDLHFPESVGPAHLKELSVRTRDCLGEVAPDHRDHHHHGNENRHAAPPDPQERKDDEGRHRHGPNDPDCRGKQNIRYPHKGGQDREEAGQKKPEKVSAENPDERHSDGEPEAALPDEPGKRYGDPQRSREDQILSHDQGRNFPHKKPGQSREDMLRSSGLFIIPPGRNHRPEARRRQTSDRRQKAPDSSPRWPDGSPRRPRR